MESVLKRVWLVAALLALVLPTFAGAGVFRPKDCVSEIMRPLSDFLDAQGTTSIFFPPVPDYIGWTGSAPDYPNFALVDYAGLANDWLVGQGVKSLHTQVNGRVWECALADGTARVTVKL
jgi:hypothetical protein